MQSLVFRLKGFKKIDGFVKKPEAEQSGGNKQEGHHDILHFVFIRMNQARGQI